MSKSVRKTIAVLCALAMVVAGIVYAPAAKTVADDYSDLVFKVSDNNPDLAIAFVTQGGVTTSQEVNYCLDQGNNFYCATTAAFTKPNFKTVTCNGNVEDPARAGANFWVPMNILNDNAYNLVTIEDAVGNTAQFVIRKGTPTPETTTQGESTTEDPSAPTTEAPPTTTTQKEVKTIPGFVANYPFGDNKVLYLAWGAFSATEYHLFVDGEDAGTTFNGENKDISSWDPGTYTLQIKAYDGDGDLIGISSTQTITKEAPTTTAEPVTTTVDPTAPTTEAPPTTTTQKEVKNIPGFVANYPFGANKALYLAWGAFAATEYHLFVDGEDAGTTFNGENKDISSWDPGTYALQVKAYDDDGDLIGISDTQTITKEAPTTEAPTAEPTTEAPVTTYDVSIDGTVVDVVEAGDTYSLPVSDVVAYVYDGEAYHSEQEVVVNEDMNFITMEDEDITMTQGASIKVQGDAGIAFQATVEGEYKNSEFVEHGLLFTANDYYTNLYNNTLDIYSEVTYGGCVKNIITEGWFDNRDGVMRSGVTGVDSANISREWISRAYYQINYCDGETSVAHYSGMSDVRSIKQVAIAVQNAGYPHMSDDEKAKVDEYAAAD